MVWQSHGLVSAALLKMTAGAASTYKSIILVLEGGKRYIFSLPSLNEKCKRMDMKRFLLFLGFGLWAGIAQAQPELTLTPVAEGLSQPVDIAHAGDGRIFIVERPGRIRILAPGGEVLSAPFLDIDSRVSPANGERGLLGLAFHPDYATNGYFFVNYTNNSGDTRVSRFRVSEGNPNLADPSSELVLLAIDQPFSNHNAGDLNFGPDGYLYVGMGDGGAGGDPDNYSQNRQSMLGKMLRLDVDNGTPYAIPPDNPFADDDFTLDEVWAIGLRNPWRFSFDRLTGDMWIGDVGQNAWEEVTFQPAQSTGGENYGWRCYEGFSAFNTGGCEGAGAYTPPVHVYQTGSADGCSITGGYVYRGEAAPALYGIYLYADYCSGKIWGLSPDGQGGWENTELFDGPGGQYASFGEDASGELYLAALTQGTVYQVGANCESPAAPEIGGEDIICGTGAAAALSASAAPAGYVFNWYLDGALLTQTVDNALQATAPGSYQVQLAAFQSGNCNSALSAAFEVEAADFPDELIENASGVLTAAPGYAAYQWLLNGSPIEGADMPTWEPQESGSYQVEITDEDGCTVISEALALVGSNFLPGLDRVTASPNPFGRAFWLALKGQGEFLLEVHNSNGQKLWGEKIQAAGKWAGQIETLDWPTGAYWLRITKGSEQHTMKLLKM